MNTLYQYEPLVTPSHWNEQERRFANRLNYLLEQIFSWHGRITFKDLRKETVHEVFKYVAETATFGSANISNLEATIASLISAYIKFAKIDAAHIANLEAQVAHLVEASIGTADIDWGRIKDLVTGQAIITQGTAGELYIARLAVTEANMVKLSVGELLVKGQDGAFYSVSVNDQGEIVTTKKQVENSDIKDVTINAGEKVIDGTITAAKLNAQNIFADSALIRRLMAANIDVDTLFAREAVMNKIVNSEQIRLLVGGVQDAANSSIQLLRDRVTTAVNQLEQVQNAVSGKADSAAVSTLGTQLQQTATEITAIIRRTEGLEADQAAADAILNEYRLTFRIAADGVTIGKSGSDFDVHIDNTRMAFRERGQVIAFISNNKLHIANAEVTQNLAMGTYIWQVLNDGSMGVIFGG